MNSEVNAAKRSNGIPDSDIHSFEIKVLELRELMKSGNTDAAEKLNTTYSGVSGLALRLNSNIQTGLNSDEQDLSNRRRLYGKNEIPPKPPKSIFVLAFEAIQDPTLILLMLCSLISIGLSFYHPPSEVSDEVYKKINCVLCNFMILIYLTDIFL